MLILASEMQVRGLKLDREAGCGAAAHAIARGGWVSLRCGASFTIVCRPEGPSYWLRRTLPTAL
jgi:hypothetical protein